VLGHTVRVSRSLFLPNIAVGDYTIIAHLPERDGELQYRVKSKLERYERVVQGRRTGRLSVATPRADAHVAAVLRSMRQS
jgi:hypothetical protein